MASSVTAKKRPQFLQSPPLPAVDVFVFFLAASLQRRRGPQMPPASDAASLSVLPSDKAEGRRLETPWDSIYNRAIWRSAAFVYGLKVINSSPASLWILISGACCGAAVRRRAALDVSVEAVFIDTAPGYRLEKTVQADKTAAVRGGGDGASFGRGGEGVLRPAGVRLR